MPAIFLSKHAAVMAQRTGKIFLRQNSSAMSRRFCTITPSSGKLVTSNFGTDTRILYEVDHHQHIPQKQVEVGSLNAELITKRFSKDESIQAFQDDALPANLHDCLCLQETSLCQFMCPCSKSPASSWYKYKQVCSDTPYNKLNRDS